MSDSLLIGPQVLEDTMIKCIFHHTDEVMKKIDSIRMEAEKTNMEFNNMLRHHEQDAAMRARGYTNTISILGSRGAGKTSIIMTLHEMLHEKGADIPQNRNTNPSMTSSCENLIMPILVPQDLTSEQTLLSWIVRQLMKKGEDIDKELQGDTYGYAVKDFWNGWETKNKNAIAPDAFHECMDSLPCAFNLRFQSGRAQAVQISEGDEVYNYLESVQKDSELRLNILKLISMIIDYYRHKRYSVAPRYPDRFASQQEANNHIPPQSNEPLMFFTIDDLDLAPERSSEVLELILRYLQHPNVVVICGWNAELFQNHLSMDLLRMQGVLETNQLNTNFTFDDVFMERYRKRTTALDSARRLALDNLKKAFPPAQRYEIRSLSIKERCTFPYAVNVPDEKKIKNIPEMFELIERAIKSCSVNASDKKPVAFLYGVKGEKLNIYSRIFDNKARGLANVYKAFEALLNRPKCVNGGPEDITYQLRNLFDIILFSNTRFAPYRRGLRDLVQIKKITVSSETYEPEYYCDYPALKKILEKYLDERVKKGEIEANAHFPMDAELQIEQKYDYFPHLIIDVYLLLNFMENLFNYIANRERAMHGGMDFSETLNKLLPPIDFKAMTPNLLTKAVISGGIQELKLFPNTDNFALNLSILNAYEEIGFSDNQFHYTGAGSLMEIFKMVDKLLSKPDGNMDENRLKKDLRADPKWLSGIIDLFSVLRPIPENVKRLAACLSLASSRHTGIDSVYADAGALLITKGLKFDKNSYNSISLNKKITDEDLDILVSCLRTIDRNRKPFMQYVLTHNPSSSSSKKSNNDAHYRAGKYLDIAGFSPVDYSKPSKHEIKLDSLKEPQEKLDVLKSITPPADYSVSDESNEEIFNKINEALTRANNDVQFLLNEIEARLQIALYNNTHFRNGPQKNMRNIKNKVQQFQYLPEAAIALRQYIEHWELESGKWGKLEIQAVSWLISIFQKNLCRDQVDIMSDIMDLGPNLSSRGRNEYGKKIATVRNWVSTHESLFAPEELKQISANLNTLAQAPKQIRRDLYVESDIYQVANNVGDVIAYNFAEVSEELFEKWKSDNKLRLTVWPIGFEHDKKFEELAKKFERLLPKPHPAKSTLFDGDYSEIELYLQQGRE